MRLLRFRGLGLAVLLYALAKNKARIAWLPKMRALNYSTQPKALAKS